MANQEHLVRLEQGVVAWNAWRIQNPDVQPNLIGANLSGANLRDADLSQAKLIEANLSGANLKDATLFEANLVAVDLSSANLTSANLDDANLSRANLRGANLSPASLNRANLVRANLSGAELEKAGLSEANLSRAILLEANLSEAPLVETIFANVELTRTKGLENCMHLGPSIVDHRTLTLSKNVPLEFWRGCGLPDQLIDYMPSLSGDAIQFYSCFISYSSKDQEFADRLHADLQNAGVRCWFAPHDLPIGKKILDGLDEAIRMRDKVLLILSHDAIDSDWVEDEVSTAFEEERRRRETILFPIRLDDAVMDTSEAWASKLRARNIGDFTRWKDHDAYMATLDRILRDLKAGR